MRRLALLLLALAGCARTAGSHQARARAGSDEHVAPGATANFEASCDGCAGTPRFQWSFAVAPQGGACALSGDGSPHAQVKCTASGEWVLKLDVTDSNGKGVPDYANLLVSGPAPEAGLIDAGGGTDAGPTDAGSFDAGSFDAGPTDAGNFDAGSFDAGPTDAGPTDAGPTDAGSTDAGPTDAGGLSGTLVVTAPDGSPVTSVLPGDLLELHATASDPGASCTFDAAPANAQYLTATTGCDAAIALLAPASNVTFGVTFTNSTGSVHATSTAVTAQAAAKINTSALEVGSVAVDLVTDALIATRPGHSVLIAAAGQTPTTRFSTNSGVACAGGTVREVAFPAGDLGRVYADGGTSTHTTSAGDFLSCATAAGTDATNYLPVLAATDGSELVAWGETGAPSEDTTYSVDAVVNVEDPASWGDLSAGVLTFTGGDTIDFVDWPSLHGFALDGTLVVPQPVSSSVFTGLTAAVTGPMHDGTLWLGDSSGDLYQYQQTLLTSAFTLGVAPDLQLAASGPVDGLGLEHDGPWAEDVWAAVGGGLQRVTAAPNTVGAAPSVLTVDVGLNGATVNGIAVGAIGNKEVLYLAASNGLYLLQP